MYCSNYTHIHISNKMILCNVCMIVTEYRNKYSSWEKNNSRKKQAFKCTGLI